MRTHLGVVITSCLFVLGFGLPAAAQSHFTGDHWRTWPPDVRVVYLSGFVDGRNQGVNEAARIFETNVLDPRLAPLAKTITVGQILEGLDEFYKDWRNTRILVRHAVEYVVMEAEGKDGTELLRFLRENAASKDKN